MALNMKNERTLSGSRFTEPLTSSQTTDRMTDTKEKVIFWVAVITSQIFGLALVIMMIVWTVKYIGGLEWEGKYQFNYHPLFLTIGLIYFYSEAILVYRVFPNQPKLRLKVVHAVIHLCVIIFTIVGFLAIFEYKKTLGGVDMYSMHSWIGVSAVGLYGLQYLLGFAMFFLPWTPVSWRAKALPFHTIFGVGIFLTAIAAALTGMMEKLNWTPNYSSTDFTVTAIIGNTYGLLLIVFGFLVVFIVTKEKYKRQPKPEEMSLNVRKYDMNTVN